MPEQYYQASDLKRLRKMRELKPELYNSFVDFNRKAFEDGALPGKVKELIAVATAHVTQCAYCIDVHTKQAKKAGATEAEIAEAIFVAIALRASSSWGHAAIAMQALEE